MHLRDLYRHVDWTPAAPGLRLFAGAVAAALGLLGLGFCLRSHAVPAPSAVLWTVAVVLLGVGAAAPGWLLWPYRVWYAVTVPVGVGLQTALLGLFFYGVLTPVGLLLRALGRDPLHRRWDRAASSYWQARPPVDEPQRYFRPY